MSESATYKGGCHCGKVQYVVNMPPPEAATTCNCSMCSRKGTMLTFVPAAQFSLQQGEEALTDYQFNKKHIHHLFCSTCGITSFARGAGPDGKEMVAVNLRCLEGLDTSTLAVNEFDGKKL